MHQDYLSAEKKRRLCSVIVAVSLLAELAGAILIFVGHSTPGLIIAAAFLALQMTTRFIGSRRYTAACADLRVRYGFGMKDAAVPENPKQLKSTIPVFPLLPTDSQINPPLVLFPEQGHWNGYETLLTEVTFNYQAAHKQRQFLSGTLCVLNMRCAVPGLMAIYGQPYGGVPLSRWKGMAAVDTGDRGYLLLAREGAEASEYLMDAFSAFDREKKATAILWTEADRFYAFLPTQFYSGNWTLFKPMPEAAVSENPLPALSDLPKLARKLQ